ncbi:MAG: hypothetical protein Q9223_005670 [Gallowayella weberi]
MLECPYGGGRSYCGSYMPLSSNIIIRCYGRRAVPANCDDNLAGIDPVGVKSSALCFDSLNGVVACYYDGFVYPDGGNRFPLPAAFAQFIHNTTTNTSSAAISIPSAIGMASPGSNIVLVLTKAGYNFSTGHHPTMPAPRITGVPGGLPGGPGGPGGPGSGGYYNMTTVTGSGLATLTGVYQSPQHARPTTTFTGGSSSLTVSVCLVTGVVLVISLISQLLAWQAT